MRVIKNVVALLVAVGVSGLLIHFIALSVLAGYPRIAQTMERFVYTELVLIVNGNIKM
ncbi:hypothetical protein RG609_11475 [Enterococcus sp. FR203]|uniref:hypothetical protein n=1 Tax=Enterococcus TaxID=1350 RepID=UPI001E5F06D2|nr:MULTISPECIES: hypothetical protein [Enterococcus]MCR9046241.1 hypothetical protein [Enterococcus faecium]MDQ8668465.1 hypothetical protein [Enterococcus sp. FR203]MDQ8683783.1 hypothetical protein [Enterococcus sp. FR209]